MAEWQRDASDDTSAEPCTPRQRHWRLGKHHASYRPACTGGGIAVGARRVHGVRRSGDGESAGGRPGSNGSVSAGKAVVDFAGDQCPCYRRPRRCGDYGSAAADHDRCPRKRCRSQLQTCFGGHHSGTHGGRCSGAEPRGIRGEDTHRTRRGFHGSRGSPGQRMCDRPDSRRKGDRGCVAGAIEREVLRGRSGLTRM